MSGSETRGPATASPRFPDIDLAKGIAIVLVVFGHMVGRSVSPPGNEWFRDIQSSLYTFHMSFFFYLAGYTYFNATEGRRLVNVRTASKKMLVAYLALGALVYIGKYIGAKFGPVDNSVDNPWSALTSLFLQPMASYAPFLWFICAVVPIYFFTLLLTRHDRFGPYILLTGAALLHIASIHIGLTTYLSIDLIGRFYIFFVIAWVAVENRDQFIAHIQRWLTIYVVAFLVCLVSLPFYLNATFAALLSIPVLHGIALGLAQRIQDTNLETGGDRTVWKTLILQFENLGKRTYTIYLFNSILMGIARFIMLKLVDWGGLAFMAFIPILLTVGLIGPLVLEALIAKKMPGLAWYIR